MVFICSTRLLFIERSVALVNGHLGLVKRLEAIKQKVLLPEALSCHVGSVILVDKLLQRNNIVVSDADLRVAPAIIAPLVGRVDSHGVSVIL